MALCIPDRLPPDSPSSERRVFNALKRLPDPWRLFHSVAWQSLRNGRQGDGEADFVLLHPEHGLIVLEVKGGGVRLDGGTWWSIGRAGTSRIADPFEQATSSKHALLRYLKDTWPQCPWLEAGHAVVFPDLLAMPDLGPAASPDLVLTGTDLAEPVAAIQRIAAHWVRDASLSEDQVETITALISPTVAVRRVLADDIAEVEARLHLLTQDQFGVLDGLRRNRRAIIYGGAGTGKTVLAAERARRLAAEGFRVLLTCFNKPLAEHLSDQLDGIDHVLVHHFHALCRWQMAVAGTGFPDDPTSEWWETGAPAALADAIEETGLRVDAVVVDEGQDFAPSWFTTLQLMLSDPDDGPFYTFADSHQVIYRDTWEAPYQAATFDLFTNCRNTLPIARCVAAVYGDEVASLGANGAEPQLIPVENVSGAIAQLPGLLHETVNEGQLRPDQVMILTQRRDVASDLQGLRMAGLELGVPRPGVVGVETFHRFTGLESDVAIVILDSLDTERDQALAYIGISRAKAHLVVIATQRSLDKLQ